MRVFVYFNLHRKLWSVKALSGEQKGRVIGHSEFVQISSPVFKVSEAGRQRVLREQRKNVHAGVEGKLLTMRLADAELEPAEYDAMTVTYNPYKHSTFVTRLGGTPVRSAVQATMVARDGYPPRVEACGVNR